jgi:hypothetical protein
MVLCAFRAPLSKTIINIEEIATGCTKSKSIIKNDSLFCDGKGGSDVRECNGCKEKGQRIILQNHLVK